MRSSLLRPDHLRFPLLRTVLAFAVRPVVAAAVPGSVATLTQGCCLCSAANLRSAVAAAVAFVVVALAAGVAVVVALVAVVAAAVVVGAVVVAAVDAAVAVAVAASADRRPGCHSLSSKTLSPCAHGRLSA